MEKYKRTLIYQCIGSVVLAAFIIALSYYFQANPIQLNIGHQLNTDQHYSHSNGILVAFAVYLVLVKCLKTFLLFHNDKHKRQSLKEYYEEQHEERRVLIDQKASTYMVFVLIFLFLIAQIVIGTQYYAVNLTLNVMMFAYALIFLGLTLYLHHKY